MSDRHSNIIRINRSFAALAFLLACHGPGQAGNSLGAVTNDCDSQTFYTQFEAYACQPHRDIPWPEPKVMSCSNAAQLLKPLVVNSESGVLPCSYNTVARSALEKLEELHSPELEAMAEVALSKSTQVQGLEIYAFSVVANSDSARGKYWLDRFASQHVTGWDRLISFIIPIGGTSKAPGDVVALLRRSIDDPLVDESVRTRLKKYLNRLALNGRLADVGGNGSDAGGPVPSGHP